MIAFLQEIERIPDGAPYQVYKLSVDGAKRRWWQTQIIRGEKQFVSFVLTIIFEASRTRDRPKKNIKFQWQGLAMICTKLKKFQRQSYSLLHVRQLIGFRNPNQKKEEKKTRWKKYLRWVATRDQRFFR